MITLLRKIRRNLLEEKKVTRYLFYAIGEILLVVIGILIALWINQEANYNRERKDEIVILKEIRDNLSSDLAEIEQDISLMDTVNVACEYVTEFFNRMEVPSKEFGRNIIKLRTTPHFSHNSSGYRLLTSIGIKIVKNDSLRKAITYHYESDYPYYKDYERERIDLRIQYIEADLLKHFTWEKDVHSVFLGYYAISAEDYIELRREKAFLKLVSTINRENNIVQNRAERLKERILNLSGLIDAELVRRAS